MTAPAAQYLEPPEDYGCCALDDAAGSGHEGPCAWVCSDCNGSTWCEGCDGTGSCFRCYEGMEVDDV